MLRHALALSRTQITFWDLHFYLIVLDVDELHPRPVLDADVFVAQLAHNVLGYLLVDEADIKLAKLGAVHHDTWYPYGSHLGNLPHKEIVQSCLEPGFPVALTRSTFPMSLDPMVWFLDEDILLVLR